MSRLAESFPDYPIESLPEIPSSWVDTSWSVDMCPCWTLPSGRLVFIDYPNALDRFFSSNMRFSLHESNAELVAITDDWDEVLKALDPSDLA